MTLKELCELFKLNQSDKIMCEFYKNQYMVCNKDKYDYESLDEDDIVGLRPYLASWILALYEYFANITNTPVADWFSRYDSVCCNASNSDIYESLLGLQLMINPNERSAIEVVNGVFNMGIERALPEFKRRGIPLDKMYDIA